MSFYGTSFANIQSGWYRETQNENYALGRSHIDQIWSKQCDDILTHYVFEYGTYFSALSEKIIQEIDVLCGSNILNEARYFEYYLANRAYEIEETKIFWEESFKKEFDRSYKCTFCKKETLLLNCHPEIIKTQGITPQYCRNCEYVIKRYESLDVKVKDNIPILLRNITGEKKCNICNRGYSLENEIFTYASFGGKSVDCLYPNLFTSICPKCFKKAFKDYKRGSKKTQLSRLYELFIFIEEIPTQDFSNLFYLFNDEESILNLFKIFLKLRTPEGYKKDFGSFFAALVASGILPEGSRKLTIGTMVLAEDGHLCLSIAEKEVDDFLFKHQIQHDKEVHYPNSKMRTDWEIYKNDHRIFIEYFGLMNNPDYAKKTQYEIKLAKENSIELIELYPEDNWREKIRIRFDILSEGSDIK